MKSKIVFLLTIIFIASIIKIITNSKNFVENFYSRLIYKNISGNINKATSLLPFSIAEILLFIFIIAILLFIILNIKNIILMPNKLKSTFNFLYSLICILIIIYIVFMSVWGLNYYRLPLSENYSYKKATTEDVYNLSEYMIKEINKIEAEMQYQNSVTNYQAINRIVESEYNNIFNEFPFLNMKYSKTKPINISKIFLYLNITGIYSPFTSEANVNIKSPNITLPFIIAHEMAHQIGIAYEDEANFIAFLATSQSEELFIKYSAYFEGLLYILYSLPRNEKYSYLISNLNENTKNDIREYYNFWNQYQGKASKVSAKVNDTYLKANNQNDGIKSYSRVVNLLVAYHKDKGII